jgi:hypothetical protein
LGNIWGKCLGRQEDKWGRRVEEEQPTVVIGQRGGDMGGNRDMSYISSVNLGKGGKEQGY